MVLKLSDVEFLTHANIPVRLGNYAWDQPEGIVKIFIIDGIRIFWFRQWSQKVRCEEMGL